MLRFATIMLALCFCQVAWAGPRVAIQPFNGPDPESRAVRQQVARIVARHGFRVLTSIPPVSGTGQYPQIARDRGLQAFVVADVTTRGNRLAVTFLIWQGVDGSVVGRWETAAGKPKLARILAKEFWKRLGPAITRSLAPPSTRLAPAPTMYIDASSHRDGNVTGVAWRKR
jgi:hypothetical protein